jgi:hypothetical protein
MGAKSPAGRAAVLISRTQVLGPSRQSTDVDVVAVVDVVVDLDGDVNVNAAVEI